MTATYIKSMGRHRITITRKEAETLAYSGTMYSILFAALDTLKGDTFTIYGSKYEVEKALRARS